MKDWERRISNVAKPAFYLFNPQISGEIGIKGTPKGRKSGEA